MMDLKSIPLFSSLGQKMTWLTERQKVLAQNIANANTPGYVPKDLKKVSFAAHLDQDDPVGGLRMQVSARGHMAGGHNGMANSFEIKAEETTVEITAPDGNAVTLEDEMVKLAETQMDYTTAVNLYRKHVLMLKTALGRNG